MTALDRRQALTLLMMAMPLAARTPAARAQTRATAKHRVALDAGHALLLEPDGTVQIWHTSQQGGRLDALLGLGPNHSLPAYTLARVPGLTEIVAVEAGAACSFAVRADGTLLAWGINGGNGKLGTTPQSFFETRASWGPDSNVPVPLAVPFDAVAVSSQNNHVLALARDGRVYAWGTGDKGQLGIGPMPVIRFRTRTPSAMPYMPFPVEIPGLSGVAAISAGYSHSLALMKDGTVRAWGENRWGEVGDGTTAKRDAPVAVPGVRNAVAVAAGGGFSGAALADGTVMTWGNRIAGALGRTPSKDNFADPTPALVPGVKDVRTIVAGDSHVLALTSSGTVVSWGQPDFGAVGRGDATVWSPALIPRLASAQSIAAHGSTSLAVLGTGRIMTWGTVRPWTRPPEEGSYDNISRRPILLWIDGLEQP
jgi:alpha-tubulin suppressor-like RCC1 family protein